MDEMFFNENVLNEGHFNSWNDKFGTNFTENISDVHKAMMQQKNIETGGGYQARVSGLYGEFTIGAIFESLPSCYHLMNDILLQTGVKYRKYEPEKYGESPWRIVRNSRNGRLYEEVKMSSQIDHILAGPTGIYIIETKNHKGYIFGDMNSRVWTQVLNGESNRGAYGGHSHYTFLNPVLQNFGHIQQLSKVAGIPQKYLIPMIVFTNPDAYLGNVNCQFCYNVESLYTYIFSNVEPIMDNNTLEKIILRIEKYNSNSYLLSKEHVKFVQDLQRRKEINKMYRGH